MNQGVTIGYGEAGPRVLVGPEVPLRKQIRAAKRLKAEEAPEFERIEVWGRDNGLIKRRRLRARDGVTPIAPPEPEAPAGEEISEQSAPEGVDEDSPVAEATGKKRATRKKKEE